MDRHSEPRTKDPREFLAQFAGRFGRSENQEIAVQALQGLLSGVRRKNAAQLSGAAGLTNPAGIQRLLRRAEWDEELVRDDLQSIIAKELGGGPPGVFVATEAHFPRRSKYAVGIDVVDATPRGRPVLAQTGLLLSYVSHAGQAIVDRELYLPRAWTDDPRIRGDDLPAIIQYQSKDEILCSMLQRALGNGLVGRWLVGPLQEESTNDVLQQYAWQLDMKFVLSLPTKTGIEVVYIPLRYDAADQMAMHQPQSPADIWRRSYGSAPVERIVPFTGDAMSALWVNEKESTPSGNWRRGQHLWLLARRPAGRPRSSRDRLALSNALKEIDLTDLAAIWSHETVGQHLLESAKRQTGLADYEARSWRAWHRHMTLVMLAHWYLNATAQLDRDL